MYCASGTMGNLAAIASHCRRGDEIILGHQNHIYNYEGKIYAMSCRQSRICISSLCVNIPGGGASALLGVAFHPIPTLADGTNRLEDMEEGKSRMYVCPVLAKKWLLHILRDIGYDLYIQQPSVKMTSISPRHV